MWRSRWPLKPVVQWVSPQDRHLRWGMAIEQVARLKIGAIFHANCCVAQFGVDGHTFTTAEPRELLQLSLEHALSDDCTFLVCGGRETLLSARFRGKTPVRWRRILPAERGASAFPVRRFSVAAVQEGSWPVCGGSGRWRRGEIRHLRRTARVIGAGSGQGSV